MSRINKRGALVSVSALIAAATLLGVASAQQEFPWKPIIFVAPGTVGGGSDTQARITADAIERSKIIKEPVAVINRGTGGSQEAYSFVKSKAGDPHYMLTATNQFVTYPMVGQAGYQWKDFTPVANLVFDPTVVVVPANSRFKTLKDFIEEAKAKPGTVTVGGGSIGTQDHQGLLTLRGATGIEVRYVPFAGGAETLRNILGSQIDVAVGNPSDFLASIEGGKLRALAMLDDERNAAPALKDVPTAKEQGYNASFVVWRGWVAPPGISEKQLASLIALFDKVKDDQNFKEKYIQRFGMRPTYMVGEEFKKYIAAREPEYRKLLTEAGVIK